MLIRCFFHNHYRKLVVVLHLICWDHTLKMINRRCFYCWSNQILSAVECLMMIHCLWYWKFFWYLSILCVSSTLNRLYWLTQHIYLLNRITMCRLLMILMTLILPKWLHPHSIKFCKNFHHVGHLLTRSIANWLPKPVKILSRHLVRICVCLCSNWTIQ